MRHAATRSLFERRDVIIVASVSCIYGLGAPVDYGAVTVRLNKGERVRRDTVLRHLVDIQYERTNADLVRGKFRVRGDTLEVQPAYEDLAVRVEFFGDDVERITELDPLTGEVLAERDKIDIYPARHFVTPREKLLEAIKDIEVELVDRVAVQSPERARQPTPHLRGVRAAHRSGELRLGHAGPVRARALAADRRADHPPDRPHRPRDRGAQDRGPDRRPARRDPPACRAAAARDRHDADQEDGRGSGRLPARDGREGALPPFRDRDPRARRDPPGPPTRCL